LIIRKEAKELRFIRQPDHAAAAADMMAAWSLDGLPDNPRRGSILSAVRSHDNGWIEEDDETIVAEDGTPVDFIAVPFDVKQRVWPRCVDRLGEYWPYVAALVAQHSLTIFRDSRTKPEWQPYFEAQTRRRDALLTRCAPQIASRLDEDYRLLRMADLMSLVLCNGWLDPLEYGGHSFVLNGDTLTVTSNCTFQRSWSPPVHMHRQRTCAPHSRPRRSKRWRAWWSAASGCVLSKHRPEARTEDRTEPEA
jgi:Protein of unknown function (DUF3891)